MTIIRRGYNKGYFQTTLHRSSPDSQRNRQRMRVVLGHHRRGRLLEVGPGTGTFLELAARWFDVEGIDISSHAVNGAPPKLVSKLRVGNIETAPLPRETYHVVAAFNILEHLREPEAVAQRIHRSLAPDGCLVGSVPCNHGPVGRFYTRLTNFFDRTHCSTLEPGQWRTLFRRAGFNFIRFFGEMPVGPRFSLHIHGQRWSRVSPNMMFVCR